MRIAIGLIQQETNTFSPIKTNIESFANGYLWQGYEILKHLSQTSTELDTNTELAGFLSMAIVEGYRVAPTVAAHSISGGRVTEEAYTFLRDALLQKIEEAASLDGVLLALHGAMVAMMATGDYY